jgi:hypothetical protein
MSMTDQFRYSFKICIFQNYFQQLVIAFNANRYVLNCEMGYIFRKTIHHVEAGVKNL